MITNQNNPQNLFDIYYPKVAIFYLPMSVGVWHGACVAAAVPPAAGQAKVLTGDLDTSLASLAENLTINKGATPPVKSVHNLVVKPSIRKIPEEHVELGA